MSATPPCFLNNTFLHKYIVLIKTVRNSILCTTALFNSKKIIHSGGREIIIFQGIKTHLHGNFSGVSKFKIKNNRNSTAMNYGLHKQIRQQTSCLNYNCTFLYKFVRIINTPYFCRRVYVCTKIRENLY